jgi:hypothetical protein
MSVAPRSATRNRIVVLKVASITRKDQVDSFTKMQRIESTTLWRRKKMRSDRMTAESEKLSVVRQQRYPLAGCAAQDRKRRRARSSHPKKFAKKFGPRSRDRHQVKLAGAFDGRER